MSTIGFGIIGCGNISAVHAQAIQAIPQAMLVAVHSKSQPRAEKMAQQYGIDYCLELDRFLDRKDIQVVNICTPSGTHAELGTRAAEAGKHIVVEKPIDVTLEKARALIDACRQANVKLAVIFQSRFLPTVRLLKKAIDRGRLGQLLLADAYVKWYRNRDYYKAAPWRGTWVFDGGGALINQSIHTVDLLHYLAGPVASIFGYAERKIHSYIEAEDTAIAVIRFSNGALGVIEGTTSVYPGFARRLEVHGEKGSVVLEGNDIALWKLQDSSDEEEELAQLKGKDRSDGSSDPMNLDTAGHRHQIEDFIGAIRENRPPRVDGREALNALEIVLSVYQSAREQRIVNIRPMGS